MRRQHHARCGGVVGDVGGESGLPVAAAAAAAGVVCCSQRP
jgi:hypothetical protein